MERLYIWNWLPTGNGGPVGYNSCKAKSRAEALRIGNAMCSLQVDESTLGVGTYEQLAKLDRQYASLCD